MSRHYTVNDIEAPSVTTVLGILDKSDALSPWAVGCAMQYIRENRVGYKERGETLEDLLGKAKNEWRNVKETAADIGSEIHGLIERYLQHGHDAVGQYRPEVERGFLAFLEWEQAHGVKWIKSEMTIFHPEHYYAGTLDAICVYEGKRYLIDFKSSKGFYDTYGMQIAAYRGAAEAMGEPTDGCGILRLDKKTGLPEWKDYTKRQERDYNAFLKLLDYYYAAAGRRFKNNPRCAEGKI